MRESNPRPIQLFYKNYTSFSIFYCGYSSIIQTYLLDRTFKRFSFALDITFLVVIPTSHISDKGLTELSINFHH